MGRVKPSEMREGVKVAQGMPFFKWDIGNKYKVVFPTLAGERDIFAYSEAVHSVTIDGRFSKIRCVAAEYQVSEESRAAVVRVDENGQLLTDKASGRILNDGSCPLCELERMYRKIVFEEVEKFKEENPDATDKDISAEYKSRFDKSPVEGVEKRTEDGTKINTTKIILGLVYKLDAKNAYILDKEGFPVYEIKGFDLSDSRFSKIHSAAENNKEYQTDTLSAITDEDGIAWTEFLFDFPDRPDKAASGKDMSISVIPAGHSAVEKYPAIVEKIQAELGDGTEYEKIFAELPSLRVRSIPEIEKLLQGKLQQYRARMTEDEKDALTESLSKEEKTLSNEDAEALLEGDLVGGSSAFENKDESGADAFLA